MAKYKLIENGVKDQETESYIPNTPGNRHWNEYQDWLAEGNTPDPEYTEEEIQEQEFNEELENLDINMNNKINEPCICEVNGIQYIMDGKEESASRLKAAIDIATLLGEITVDIVDYYNEVYYGVSLVDALEICKCQALHYRGAYYERAYGRDYLIKQKKK